jgi:ABC-type antimicrobial peptide transport system permease subunit
MALGAAPSDIVRLIMSRAFVIGIAGVALGVGLAIPTMRLLVALLYRVQPGDPVVLAVLAAVVLAVALVASYVPARRATRVDPLTTLRTE